MKQIPLAQNKFALVDDEDFDFLNQWKWKISNKGYVVRSIWEEGKSKIIWMHRLIMDTPRGMETDHEDLNKLNCQRYNLRICSHAQNNMNTLKHSNNTSGYKGVRRVGQRFRTEIGTNGGQIHIGYFSDVICAAQAYDEAAIKYHKEFARLNFPIN